MRGVPFSSSFRSRSTKKRVSYVGLRVRQTVISLSHQTATEVPRCFPPPASSLADSFFPPHSFSRFLVNHHSFTRKTRALGKECHTRTHTLHRPQLPRKNETIGAPALHPMAGIRWVPCCSELGVSPISGGSKPAGCLGKAGRCRRGLGRSRADGFAERQACSSEKEEATATELASGRVQL